MKRLNETVFLSTQNTIMFKLIGREINVILAAQNILIWTYTLCMLGNFVCFLSSDFFQKVFKKVVRNTINVSNRLNINVSNSQAQHFVEPYIGPNCLQRLLADATGKELINKKHSLSPSLKLFYLGSFYPYYIHLRSIN